MAVVASSNRSSAASYGSELRFKALFKLTKLSNGNSVYFKQDGERFDSEETLKLQSATDYSVRMEISPAFELLYIKMAGIEYSFQLITDPEDEAKAVYQFTWSTHGIDPTVNRHRSDVLCSMKFKNYKELDFKLQVKFYDSHDGKHITWGQRLNSVVLDCTAGRGTYLSNVDGVKFF